MAEPASRMREVSYALAVRTALREEMLRDERVFLMGENIGIYGGVYGATRGLLQEFGPERVRDTPISEAAIAGMAIGAALAGMRPVAEIMYCDFLSLALDAIANNAAKLRYMSGGQLSVPLVVRTSAGGHGYGAQHSQSLENWVAHIPGLKVVMPGNCADARGLLKAAIRDPDPVVVIEHKALYQTRGAMPASETAEPIGVAKLLREVSPTRIAAARAAATLVSWSLMAEVCVEAAEELSAEDIEVEVLDLRTLLPLDIARILASVRKTGRLVVAQEAVAYAGFGGEVVAQVVERVGAELKAPPVRVGARFAPIPFGEPLERFVVPAKQEVIEAVLSSGTRA